MGEPPPTKRWTGRLAMAGKRVYWTEGKSSVYHLSRKCPRLVRATTVCQGIAQSAAKAGKTQPCKRCERMAREQASASGRSAERG